MVDFSEWLFQAAAWDVLTIFEISYIIQTGLYLCGFKGVIMRGGKRSGAGRKPLESTVVVRVPIGVVGRVKALIQEYQALQKVVTEIKQDEPEPALEPVTEIKQGGSELILESVPEIKQDELEPNLNPVTKIKPDDSESELKPVTEIKQELKDVTEFKVQQKLKELRKLSTVKQRTLKKQHGGLYNAAIHAVQCDIERERAFRSFHGLS
jgi:hypothetical protein